MGAYEKLVETDSFRVTDRKLIALLKKLNARNVCGCCVARALLFNGLSLAIDTMGSVAAAEMLEELAAGTRAAEYIPAPPPSAMTH
jgi:hypothetical protein